MYCNHTKRWIYLPLHISAMLISETHLQEAYDATGLRGHAAKKDTPLDESSQEFAEQEAKGLVYVLGGEAIYGEAILHADFMRLTEIHRDYDGEVHFPEYRPIGEDWVQCARHDMRCVDKKSGEEVDLSFVDYARPEWWLQVAQADPAKLPWAADGSALPPPPR